MCVGDSSSTFIRLLSNFTKCLKESPSGTAPGPGGCTNEFLQVCLDDDESLQLLYLAAQDLASGKAPPEASVFMLANMTVLSRKDGGVRGIATGTSLRRLVAKSLAKAVWHRSGESLLPIPVRVVNTEDCVGHAVRLATDLDPPTTVLSIDGVGAYDHVLQDFGGGKLSWSAAIRLGNLCSTLVLSLAR